VYTVWDPILCTHSQNVPVLWFWPDDAQWAETYLRTHSVYQYYGFGLMILNELKHIYALTQYTSTMVLAWWYSVSRNISTHSLSIPVLWFWPDDTQWAETCLCTHSVYQYYGFGLIMAQWVETCRRIFNFLYWLPIYVVFIDEINLLYYQKCRPSDLLTKKNPSHYGTPGTRTFTFTSLEINWH